MANIGTFTAQNEGFTGTVRTLTLKVKVKLVRNAARGAPNSAVSCSLANPTQNTRDESNAQPTCTDE